MCSIDRVAVPVRRVPTKDADRAQSGGSSRSSSRTSKKPTGRLTEITGRDKVVLKYNNQVCQGKGSTYTVFGKVENIGGGSWKSVTAILHNDNKANGNEALVLSCLVSVGRARSPSSCYVGGIFVNGSKPGKKLALVLVAVDAVAVGAAKHTPVLVRQSIKSVTRIKHSSTGGWASTAEV
jgi:hypothetical protein